ncbi:MAG TPA: TorF family putative porin [Azospirillaceae bacterium]|nr:TorF family putative porin [Azospirillaceae bacterium]
MRAPFLLPALLPFLILATPAAAQVEVTGEAAIVSDYVDRGISNSDNDAAVQAGIGVAAEGGAYVSLWGSTVDFDDGQEATIELDYILGYAGAAAGVEYDLSVAYVSYPGASGALDYDLWEFGAVATRALGPVVLVGEAIYTPQNSGKAGDGLYLSGGLELPLGEAVTIGTHVGRQWVDDEEIAGPDYMDWGVGLVWSLGRLELGLRYTDTDLGREDCPRLCDSRVVFQAGIALP